MRVAALGDAPRLDKRLDVVVDLDGPVLIGEDDRRLRAGAMMGRAEHPPAQRDGWGAPERLQKRSDAPPILDHDEFIRIEKSDPGEAPESSADAVLLGGRRCGDFRPVHQSDLPRIHPGLDH